MPVLSSRSMLALGTATVVVGIAGHLAAQWLFFFNDGNWFATMAQQRVLTVVQYLLNAVLYIGSGLVAGSFVVAALTGQRPEAQRPPTG